MAESTAPQAVTEGREPPAPPEKRWDPGAAAFLVRAHTAAVGGVLLFLAFPPVGVWPLAAVGAAAIALAVYRQRARRAALFGFLAGLGLFVPLLIWINAMLAGAAPTTAALAWIGLSAAQAAYFIPLGIAMSLVSRLPGWPVWSAALWVGDEALRGRLPLGGLTWGRLAFSQGHSPLTPYASLGGAPLVTFLVALTGGLLAQAAVAAWTRRNAPSSRGRHAPVAALLVMAVAVPSAGYLIPTPTDGKQATVAAVQGNVTRPGLDFLGRPRAILENHVDATHQLAGAVRKGKAPQPDFVIWPENASDIDPYTNDIARSLIHGAASDVGAPMLVGALAHGRSPQYVRNLGIVWNPRTGPGETYLKRHLVPFGEYVPFRDVLTGWIPLLEKEIPKDKVAGTKPGLLHMSGVPIADAICFDVAYDDIVRQAVTAGGRLITVQTNNATYGYTAQPDQQLAIERLRAVEHGRTVVVAATSGVSAIIAPDGDVVERSQLFTRDVLVQRVPLRHTLTIADRLGPVPEWTLVGIGLLALAAAVVASRDTREPRGKPAE